jgi:hypothetical protein
VQQPKPTREQQQQQQQQKRRRAHTREVDALFTKSMMNSNQ